MDPPLTIVDSIVSSTRSEHPTYSSTKGRTMCLSFDSTFSRLDKNTFQLIVPHPEGQGDLQLKLTRKWISHWLCDHAVKGDGPWQELLGSPLNARLSKSRTPYRTASELFENAAEIMGRELFTAFQFPRIRTHDCFSLRGDFKCAAWEIVLPRGATAILCGPANPDHFITAFYERKARDTRTTRLRPEDRWRHALVTLMRQILNRLRHNDLAQIAALSLTVDSDDSGKREIRVNFRFLCPENWGITWDDEGPYFDETFIPDGPWAASAAPLRPVIRLVPRS